VLFWKILAFITFEENDRAKVPEVLGNAYLSEIFLYYSLLSCLDAVRPGNGSVP